MQEEIKISPDATFVPIGNEVEVNNPPPRYHIDALNTEYNSLTGQISVFQSQIDGYTQNIADAQASIALIQAQQVGVKKSIDAWNTAQQPA